MPTIREEQRLGSTARGGNGVDGIKIPGSSGLSTTQFEGFRQVREVKGYPGVVKAGRDFKIKLSWLTSHIFKVC